LSFVNVSAVREVCTACIAAGRPSASSRALRSSSSHWRCAGATISASAPGSYSASCTAASATVVPFPTCRAQQSSARTGRGVRMVGEHVAELEHRLAHAALLERSGCGTCRSGRRQAGIFADVWWH
jgi:hypothetical protein